MAIVILLYGFILFRTRNSTRLTNLKQMLKAKHCFLYSTKNLLCKQVAHNLSFHDVSRTKFMLFFFYCLLRPLTNEQRTVENAIILFTVKDKDLFSITNQFIAECYMSFQEIALLNGNREQIHLKLSRPNSSGK